MPSVSFKKDELRVLWAVLNNHLIGLRDTRDEYERQIAAGKADSYDEREYERMKDTVEYFEGISYKLSKKIYPTGAS